jgi:hypothetical protein
MVIMHRFGQESFVLHAGFNDPSELLLVFVFYLINLVPHYIVMLVPSDYVDLPQPLGLKDEQISLIFSFLNLPYMLPFHFSQNVRVMGHELLFPLVK